MANASRQYCDFGSVKEQLGLEHILDIGGEVRKAQGCEAFMKLLKVISRRDGLVLRPLAAAGLGFWVRAGLVV